MIYSLENYDEAYRFVTSHEGYTIKDLGNGQYEVVQMPDTTKEELVTEKKTERNSYLEQTDKMVLPDYPLTEDERNSVIEYRNYLRNITKNPDFPNVEIKTPEEWQLTNK